MLIMKGFTPKMKTINLTELEKYLEEKGISYQERNAVTMAIYEDERNGKEYNAKYSFQI